ncbi:MAG: response regulator [Phycisphaeraceae bacterium]
MLVAEDDPDDRTIIQVVFQDTGVAQDIRFVDDGKELMDYLFHRGVYAEANNAPRPSLILLDLKMPKKDGYEALAEIRADPELRSIPVIVLTVSSREEDIVRSYELGANSYITKPDSYGTLLLVIRRLGQYWFDTVKLPPN